MHFSFSVGPLLRIALALAGLLAFSASASAQITDDPVVVKLDQELTEAVQKVKKLEDYNKVRPLIDKAAAVGLRRGLTIVGLGYRDGLFGYPEDDAKAVDYLTRAARTPARPLDGSNPILFLTQFYRDRKNDIKEYEWHAAGAAAGFPENQLEYALAAADGLHGVAKNEPVAVAMMKQAALAEQDEAMIRIAIWLEDGRYGVQVDKEAARHWYLKARYTPAGLKRDISNILNRMDGKRQTWGSYAQPWLPESEKVRDNSLPARRRSASSAAESQAYNEWWAKTWGPGGSANVGPTTQSAWPTANRPSTAERDQAAHQARMNKFQSDWDKEMNRNRR